MSAQPLLPIASALAVHMDGREAGRMTPQYYDALRKIIGFLQSQIDQINAVLADISDLEDGQTDINAALALKADKIITITGINSLSGGGDLSANRTLSLDNDNDAPGNSYFYGTDTGGAKGWLPSLNTTMGVATLVAGTVTVTTSDITASSRVFLSVQVQGGTSGFLSLGTVTAGTSFVINSKDAAGTLVADTSTVAWWIVEPA